MHPSALDDAILEIERRQSTGQLNRSNDDINADSRSSNNRSNRLSLPPSWNRQSASVTNQCRRLLPATFNSSFSRQCLLIPASSCSDENNANCDVKAGGDYCEASRRNGTNNLHFCTTTNALIKTVDRHGESTTRTDSSVVKREPTIGSEMPYIDYRANRDYGRSSTKLDDGDECAKRKVSESSFSINLLEGDNDRGCKNVSQPCDRNLNPARRINFDNNLLDLGESCEEDESITAGLVTSVPIQLPPFMTTPDQRHHESEDVTLMMPSSCCAGNKQSGYQLQDNRHQWQSNLVQRLQTKVMHYKERCRTLELKLQLLETENQNRKTSMDGKIGELEASMQRLEDERQRACALKEVNAQLRRQLDQAQQRSQQLTNDLARTSQEVDKVKDQLARRETEWRDEEQAFNDYFASEHGRLIVLWRGVGACHRHLVEVKGQIERDLATVKADFGRVVRACQSACANLETNTRNSDGKAKASLDWEQGERKRLECQLEEATRCNRDLQQQLDADGRQAVSECQTLRRELDRVKAKLSDRDLTVERLHQLVRTSTGSLLGPERKECLTKPSDIDDPVAKALVDDLTSMLKQLRDLAHSVLSSNSDNELIASSAATPCCQGNLPLRSGSWPACSCHQPNASRLSSCSPIMRESRNLEQGEQQPLVASMQTAVRKLSSLLADACNKISSLQAELSESKVQLDDVESERQRIEVKLADCLGDLESTKRDFNTTLNESDQLRVQLESSQRQMVELTASRVDLSQRLDQAEGQLTDVRSKVTELSQERDHLTSELTNAECDLERATHDLEKFQQRVDDLECRLAEQREEGTRVREALQCARLDGELKATERADLQDSLSKADAKRCEMETELVKLRSDETILRDRIDSQQHKIDDLTSKRQSLTNHVKGLEQELVMANRELRCVESDRSELRDCVLHFEGQLGELNADKSKLVQALAISETGRDQLEHEMGKLNKIKLELGEQLNTANRQKKSLSNELAQANQDIDRLRDVIGRINAEKEGVMRARTELTNRVASSQRDLDKTCDQLASVCKEQQSLEADYCRAKQRVIQLETQISLLETTNHELKVKRDNLQVELTRTVGDLQAEFDRTLQGRDQLIDQARQRETDLKESLLATKQAYQQETERLHAEIIECQQCTDATVRGEAEKHAKQLDELARARESEKKTLESQICQLQRDRDEVKLAGEREKQALVASFDADKVSLAQRLQVASRCTEELQDELDRQRLDGQSLKAARDQRERDLANQLTDLESQLGHLSVQNDETVKSLQDQLEEAVGQRDSVNQQCGELKLQLRLLEEMRDELKQNVADLSLRLRQTADARETLRKEIVDIRRALGERERERDALEEAKAGLGRKIKMLEQDKADGVRTCNELTNQLASLEEQLTVNRKEIGDLKTSLRDNEKSRFELRRELNETRSRVKELTVEGGKQSTSLDELRDRLQREAAKLNESREEKVQLKQRINSLESIKTEMRKEISTYERRLSEMQQVLSSRERESKQAISHALTDQRRINDVRNQLQTNVDSLTSDLSQLRLTLNEADDKVQCLDGQLQRSECARRDVEGKLASVYSSLRRFVGFNASGVRQSGAGDQRSSSSSGVGGVTMAAAVNINRLCRSVSKSPNRSRVSRMQSSMSELQSQDGSGNRCAEPAAELFNPADFDPELVRTALQDFAQRSALVKRDYEDSQLRIQSLQSRLQEQADQTEQWARKLSLVQQALCAAEADKKGIDSRLSNTQATLLQQDEALREQELERHQQTDRIVQLERQLNASESACREVEEKLAKTCKHKTQLEEDYRHARRALDEGETRAANLEVNRQALEADLERMRKCVVEKDREIATLRDRLQGMGKQCQELDSKAQMLANTVDKLKGALTKTEKLECTSKERMQQLIGDIEEQNHTMQGLQDRLGKVQQELTDSDRERRIAQERLDHARNGLQDTKRQNQELHDALQKSQSELTEAEIRCNDLTSQVRHLQSNLVGRDGQDQEVGKKIHQLSRDKQELTDRLTLLQTKSSQLEAERDKALECIAGVEREKSQLKRQLDKAVSERQQKRLGIGQQQQDCQRHDLDRSRFLQQQQGLQEENAALKCQLNLLQNRFEESRQDKAEQLAGAEAEIDRLRTNQMQSDRILEARESAHQQRVKALENQMDSICGGDQQQPVMIQQQRDNTAHKRSNKQPSTTSIPLNDACNIQPSDGCRQLGSTSKMCPVANSTAYFPTESKLEVKVSRRLSASGRSSKSTKR